MDVIPNGIDRAVFFPKAAEAGASSSPIRVGSLGRLVALKGFDVLVEAVRLMAPDANLVFEVVGEGPERAHLESLAAGLPITFAPPIADRTEVADFLRSLDLFVLPSKAEGLSNVILEAVSCGVPVVAYDGSRHQRGGPGGRSRTAR